MKSIMQEKVIEIPADVTLDLKARVVKVTGPRGSLSKSFKHVNLEMSHNAAKKTLKVVVWHGGRKHIACIRTVCSHISNMIKGVTIGFEYKMRYVYAHFPINVNVNDAGTSVEIRNFLGEKIIRRVAMLEGVNVGISTAQKDELVITGNDIQNVSQSGERYPNPQLPLLIKLAT